jgi:lysyl-tRNA synthetase class 2
MPTASNASPTMAHPDQGQTLPAGDRPSLLGTDPSRAHADWGQTLAARARVVGAIRHFFDIRGFIEVETPIRIDTPAVETFIDAPPAGAAWLRTSPELHMKRLVCAGVPRIYQLGACFRQEERGDRHHDEFTMLEWYRTEADAEAILAETVELLQHVSTVVSISQLPFTLTDPWLRIAVRDAFREYAGWDPVTDYDQDRFDLDLINCVEPALPQDRPVVLFDYPREAAALARCRQDAAGDWVGERWELYLGGLELANAYTELTDAVEQRQRFEESNAERIALGKAPYRLDEPFLAALTAGMPPCGGIALGVDRLVMLLTGATSIEQVRPFCRESPR